MISFSPEDLMFKQRPEIPISRWPGIILIIICLVGIIFSSVVHVDILASSKGKVIPHGNEKIIKSPMNATVNSILVQNGAMVTKGDLLLTLDMDIQKSDLQSIEIKIDNIRKKLHSISIILGLPKNFSYDDGLRALSELARIDSIYSAVIYDGFRSLLDDIKDAQYEVDESILAIQAQEYELNQNNIDIEYNQSLLKGYQTLYKNKFISNLEVQKIKYYLASLKANRIVKEHNSRIMKAKYSYLLDGKNKIINKYVFELRSLYERLSEDIVELNIRANMLKTDIGRSQIMAPLSGYVEELSVNISGGYIASGEALLKITPNKGRNILEILISNNDIGFVRPGASVRAKLDAYTYTRYGAVDGVLVYIFKDAINIDGNSFYKAYVELKTESVVIDGVAYKIEIGMTADVDIITGTRTIISYFIEPILSGFDRAFKER
ncbi:HlyD family type I secretion periplasmic adaptor subunit [Aeromonas hydrophila]|uniref:HlyD family type I secretion periplasmic adaptor subunit n=1 Tax=Aeromonas hydrophila TaxID=644 RepID=UPI0021E6BD88|nr:HlyD family type I secretion periplasmic adaptor subunit [Aeromonas hydrophila]MCV3275094.1 HlyD family type I secretion periplasmic adaptor subunit [Aeromonas hydrophila]